MFSAIPQGKSTDMSLLAVSRISKVLDNVENKQTTDNACKSISDNVHKVGDTIVDKYALELQTTMKKD